MGIEVLLPLILQYGLQYGLPWAIQLIDIIKKPTVTWDEIQAFFATARTPYGLTPQLLAPITFLGTLVPAVPAVAGPPDVDPKLVIVSIKPPLTGPVICNSLGDCWVLQSMATVVRTKGTDGEYWVVGVMRFWVTQAALTAAGL